MNPLEAEQQQRNLDSRDRWELFAPHRRRVTQLLLEANRSATDRLCVLGAGNSNDLDLPGLAYLYGEVHLVDLDSQSLAAGVAKQCPNPLANIKTCGGVDVSGMIQALAHFNIQRVPTPEEAAACIAGAVQSPVPPVLNGPFDVVASVCLLSQLIEAAVLSWGDKHPQFFDLALAIRTRHLKLLAQLLVPGGRGVLVTDVVSSLTSPELLTVSDVELPDLMLRLFTQNNFFHGVNPLVLNNLLTSDNALAPLVSHVELLKPWRWDLGPRTYAVTALRFCRK